MKQEDENSQQGYQTSKIPWFIILIWVAFLVWAVWYALAYFFPELFRWMK